MKNLGVVDLFGRIFVTCFVAFFDSDGFRVGTADACAVVDSRDPSPARARLATIRATLAGLAPPNSSLHQ